MEKYIVLSPETFLWFNECEGVLYNCKSNNLLAFNCNQEIYNCCNELNTPFNLYSVPIDDYYTDDFQSWVKDIIFLNIGKIYTIQDKKNKIVSYPPILNLRNEIEDQKSIDSSYRDVINPASCIHEISFFLGGNTDENDYYKQFLYPINSEYYLEYESIKFLLDSNNIEYVKKINIIGANITRYKDLDKLIILLGSLNISINYYVYDSEIEKIGKLLDGLNMNNICYNIYFKSPDTLISTNKIVREYGVDCNWIFLIDNEDKITIYESICRKFKLERFEFWPIITNYNKEFFTDNIFTTISDIEQRKHSKRMIFCNQVINSNFWGNLFI